MEFRLLNEDDIEVRVQSVNMTYDKSAVKDITLLLYKNARVDMNILDETVGAANWQREHYECKGNLFCKVGILVADGDTISRWVWKSDCGTESNTEAQKGEASDSFKRACFNWGIGRELYTCPVIKVKPEDVYMINNKCYDKFTVEKIVYDDSRRISGISIKNRNGKRVFVWQRQ